MRSARRKFGKTRLQWARKVARYRRRLQVVSMVGAPIGGSFTLTYGGQSIGPIPVDSSSVPVEVLGSVLVTGRLSEN
jgi:hypothetical protein